MMSDDADASIDRWLLTLDLALHIVDGIARFDLEGDGLARDYAGAVIITLPSISSEMILTGLHEDLHYVSAAR